MFRFLGEPINFLSFAEQQKLSAMNLLFTTQACPGLRNDPWTKATHVPKLEPFTSIKAIQATISSRISARITSEVDNGRLWEG